MNDLCDICGSEDGGIAIPRNAQFRNMRIVCWAHYFYIEQIRSDEAYKAYKYGKKDWHDRLMRNVAKRLKPLYRSSINNPFYGATQTLHGKTTCLGCDKDIAPSPENSTQLYSQGCQT